MKMYILILRDVPDDLVPVITAHAAVACYLKFKKNEFMQEWSTGVFNKEVCSVTQKEFDNALQTADYVIMTESSLGGRIVAVAFSPRPEWPKGFRFYPRWKVGMGQDSQKTG